VKTDFPSLAEMWDYLRENPSANSFPMTVTCVSGNFISVNHCFNGKPHGKFERFFSNRQIAEKGHFANGKPHGTFTMHDKQGYIWWREEWHNGKLIYYENLRKNRQKPTDTKFYKNLSWT